MNRSQNIKYHGFRILTFNPKNWLTNLKRTLITSVLTPFCSGVCVRGGGAKNPYYLGY